MWRIFRPHWTHSPHISGPKSNGCDQSGELVICLRFALWRQRHGSITSILVHRKVAYEASQQIAAAAARLCLVPFNRPLYALTLRTIQCCMWDIWLPKTKTLHWLMPRRYVNRMQGYCVSFAVLWWPNSFLATECWKINNSMQCLHLFCSYTNTVLD